MTVASTRVLIPDMWKFFETRRLGRHKSKLSLIKYRCLDPKTGLVCQVVCCLSALWGIHVKGETILFLSLILGYKISMNVSLSDYYMFKTHIILSRISQFSFTRKERVRYLKCHGVLITRACPFMLNLLNLLFTYLGMCFQNHFDGMAGLEVRCLVY